MKAVVFYESADDVREKAPLHFEAHSVWFRAFAERGALLMIGTFADPGDGRSDGRLRGSRVGRGVRRRRPVRDERRREGLHDQGLERDS